MWEYTAEEDFSRCDGTGIAALTKREFKLQFATDQPEQKRKKRARDDGVKKRSVGDELTSGLAGIRERPRSSTAAPLPPKQIQFREPLPP